LESKVCLASFNLVNILDISILPDFHYLGKKNIINIYLRCWNKKDELKGPRRFIFGFANREEMYKWTMTLNFLRVKAIHDDFTLKFGMMNLPLKHEIKPELTKIFKRKFKFDNNYIQSNKNFLLTDTSNNANTDLAGLKRTSADYQFSRNLFNKRLSSFFSPSNTNFNLEDVYHYFSYLI
jgi:hypothetical protein